MKAVSIRSPYSGYHPTVEYLETTELINWLRKEPKKNSLMCPLHTTKRKEWSNQSEGHQNLLKTTTTLWTDQNKSLFCASEQDTIYYATACMQNSRLVKQPCAHVDWPCRHQSTYSKTAQNITYLGKPSGLERRQWKINSMDHCVNWKRQFNSYKRQHCSYRHISSERKKKKKIFCHTIPTLL